MIYTVRIAIVRGVFKLGLGACGASLALMPHAHPSTLYMKGRVAQGQQNMSAALSVARRSKPDPRGRTA